MVIAALAIAWLGVAVGLQPATTQAQQSSRRAQCD